MKTYEIIYADPPWKYGSRGARSGMFGELDYSTMTISELCNMNVPSSKTCLLFMWVTSPFMMEANIVAKYWGFKYIRVDSVWNKIKPSGKQHGVCGPHGMTDVEFLLLFGKGDYMSLYKQKPYKKNQYTSVTEEFTGKHSEKPNVFRARIEDKILSTINKLEMFARTSPSGWDVFGNEVENSIELC